MMHNSFVLLIVISCVLAGAFGGVLGAATAWLVGKVRGRPSTTVVRAASAAGVLIFAIAGGFAGSWLIDTSIEAQMDAQDADVVLLHRYDPDDYEKIVAIIRSSPAPTAQARRQMQQIVTLSISKRAKQIDDDIIGREFSLKETEATYLRDRDPAACLRMWSGDDVSGVVTPAMDQAQGALGEALVQQVLVRPATPASPLSADKRQALARGALDGLPSGEEDVASALLIKSTKPTTDADTRAMCDYFIGYFGGALAGPKGTLRSLIAARGG